MRQDDSRLYVAEVTGQTSGDISTAVSQLTVINTGTGNPVTPPKHVNPITVVVHNAATAVGAILGATSHAIGSLGGLLHLYG